ncbi:MAG TPA: hypothetical protein VF867_11600 [Arthrobacter sp.]
MSQESPGTSRAERLKVLVLPDSRDTGEMKLCLEEAGVFTTVKTVPAPAALITTLDAAVEEFLRPDRSACECRRSPFDKHTVNPPCSTRRDVTTRMRAALEAAVPRLFAGVLELMGDPEHYDIYGPSEGYVSVENLRQAIPTNQGVSQ